MRHSKTILHPTDLSLRSRCAFEIADSLAREQGAQLNLLHVLPNPGDAAARGRATRTLARITQSDANDRMRWTILAGDTAANILWMADEFRFDLIVMASETRSCLKSLVSPSVSQNVARQAVCPVLRIEVPASWFSESDNDIIERLQDARPAQSPGRARGKRCRLVTH